MGCRGPTTYNACGVMRWNGAVSYPIQSGHGCIGCSEAGFWDKGPFYQHLATFPGFGVETTADTIGAYLAAAAAGGLAVHAISTNIRKRRILKAEMDKSMKDKESSPRAGRKEKNNGQRIVVDPITRIEGHLRVEAEVEGGKIVDAYSSGTMVRGIEIILRGRDPRDAWAFCERACGVCTTVHSLASVRTVENALGITVPPNAELVRNLIFVPTFSRTMLSTFTTFMPSMGSMS